MPEAAGKPEPEPPQHAMSHTGRAPGLIQRYRELLQTRLYARRTVTTYEQWLCG